MSSVPGWFDNPDDERRWIMYSSLFIPTHLAGDELPFEVHQAWAVVAAAEANARRAAMDYEANR